MDRHDSEINELSLFLHGISLLCNHLITVDGESNDLTRLLFHIARFNKRLQDFKLCFLAGLVEEIYRQAYSALVSFLDSYTDIYYQNIDNWTYKYYNKKLRPHKIIYYTDTH